MHEAGPSVIGLDWRTPIGDARARLGDDTVVQGNLDPALVLAGTEPALAGAARACSPTTTAIPATSSTSATASTPTAIPACSQAVVDLVHEQTRDDHERRPASPSC